MNASKLERPECFFCKKPIVGKAEKHHRICRRYYRKGSDHRKGNIVKACSSCHRRYHHEIDNPRWKLWEFKRALELLNFGEGIFAGD